MYVKRRSRLVRHAGQMAHLKAVSSTLTYKGYECFLPVYNTTRQWSDRVKTVSVPLFPGYLFGRFDVQHRLPILMTQRLWNCWQWESSGEGGRSRARSGAGGFTDQAAG